jgi:hypothetical protein
MCDSRLLGERGASSAGFSETANGVAILDGLLLVRRTVTEAGMLWLPSTLPARGEPRGVVFEVGGRRERAVCTRSSIFCIRERRLFICMSDSERGRTSEDWRLGRVLGLVRGGGLIGLASEVATLVLDAID